MSARPARAVLVLAVAAASSVVAPGPATAAGSAGYCPDANGVTVVVDFKELGGGTVVRCAPGDQATGLAALKNAGFQIAGTLRWGEGFICRIEGKPSTSTEKCVDTPPASAYWSYWHAPHGGSWTYSDKGVLNRTPPTGSFEGWAFSLNRRADNAPRPAVPPSRPAPPPRTTPPASPPRSTPPAPRPPSPPPQAAPPPAAAGTTPPAAPGSPSPVTEAPPTTAGTAQSPTDQATGTPPAAGTTPTGVPPAAPPAEPAAPITPTEVTAAPDTPNGLPLATLAGLLLLVALAGGGIVAARRRRTVDPDD
ncbi:hypothetical protein [Micromonospora fluostatini]